MTAVMTHSEYFISRLYSNSKISEKLMLNVETYLFYSRQTLNYDYYDNHTVVLLSVSKLLPGTSSSSSSASSSIALSCWPSLRRVSDTSNSSFHHMLQLQCKRSSGVVLRTWSWSRGISSTLFEVLRPAVFVLVLRPVVLRPVVLVLIPVVLVLRPVVLVLRPVVFVLVLRHVVLRPVVLVLIPVVFVLVLKLLVLQNSVVYMWMH